MNSDVLRRLNKLEAIQKNHDKELDSHSEKLTAHDQRIGALEDADATSDVAMAELARLSEELAHRCLQLAEHTQLPLPFEQLRVDDGRSPDKLQGSRTRT